LCPAETHQSPDKSAQHLNDTYELSFVQVCDSVGCVETRKHYWNGHWGRLARTDIFVRVDGDMWLVELRGAARKVAVGSSTLMMRTLPSTSLAI
jgi:hypothetical protein